MTTKISGYQVNVRFSIPTIYVNLYQGNTQVGRIDVDDPALFPLVTFAVEQFGVEPRMNGNHTTIARNTGGSGVYVNTLAGFPSTVAMTNAIFSDNDQGIMVTALGTATLTSTLWRDNNTNWSGNVTHSDDHNGDPKFALDSYHLLPGSAAIDKGVNAGVSDDIDGDHRPYGSGCDVGADEFDGTVLMNYTHHSYPPLGVHSWYPNATQPKSPSSLCLFCSVCFYSQEQAPPCLQSQIPGKRSSSPSMPEVRCRMPRATPSILMVAVGVDFSIFTATPKM